MVHDGSFRDHLTCSDLRPRRHRSVARKRYPQPAPKDHPWRSMPYEGMTPHMAGTSLSAQTRSAAGTREILECWLEGRPIRQEYLIVDGGKPAGTGSQSYSTPGYRAEGSKSGLTIAMQHSGASAVPRRGASSWRYRNGAPMKPLSSGLNAICSTS